MFHICFDVCVIYGVAVCVHICGVVCVDEPLITPLQQALTKTNQQNAQ